MIVKTPSRDENTRGDDWLFMLIMCWDVAGFGINFMKWCSISPSVISLPKLHAIGPWDSCSLTWFASISGSYVGVSFLTMVVLPVRFWA